MPIELRDYQYEAIESIFNYYQEGNDGNIILALPTGVGKSLVIAGFVYRTFQLWYDQRFLILSHVEKILTQDYKAIKMLWNEAPVGLYSAGLNRKDIAHPIVIGGVASVVNNIKAFGHRDIIFVDEVHLVSPDENTMYRKIIKGLMEINPNLKVIGTSATIYRLGQGLLTDGDLFDDVCIDLTTVSCFNRFIEEGYLAPLIPKRTDIEIDISNVKISNGDYAVNELDDATEKVIYEAIKEAIQYGQNRNCWIVFCSSIKTSEHAAEILQSFGIPALAIHSKLSKEECNKRFEAFERGELRAICGNDKFTTGYDFPPIDFGIMLRSTTSASKWVQMLGRLTRPYDFNNSQQYIEGFDYVKENALVLDFAGNTKRLGPINDVVIPKKKGSKTSEAPVKICEHCNAYNHASARHCCNCGAEFVFKTKLIATADTSELIRSNNEPLPVIEHFDVDRVVYHLHQKKNMSIPPMMKVTYHCGIFNKFNEYVCLEHKGYAGKKARDWWRQRYTIEPPATIRDALQYCSLLRVPKRIRVWCNKRYPEVLNYEW